MVRHFGLCHIEAAAFQDPAEFAQASASDDPAEHALEAFCPACRHPVDAVCPKCSGMVESAGAELDPEADKRAWERLRRILNYARSHRNSKFVIDCAYIAFGLAEADGLSMTVVAARCAVGKAAVSKMCRQIVQDFHIQPSRYMMSEEGARKFRETNWSATKPTL